MQDSHEDGTIVGGGDTAGDIFGILNLLVAIIFTFEMGMRIIAGGFISGHSAYLNNGWNIFDGAVVSSIWVIWLAEAVGWIGTDSNIAFTLTAFRAFRTFRFFEGTRQIIATLHVAQGTLSLIGTLMIVLFIMFSVMGREAFAGALTRTCEPFIPQNYTDLCTGEVVMLDTAGGGHRRQLGGGATQGDLRDLFDREDGMLDECWAQEKPVWYTEKYTDACPLTLPCTTTEHGCWEIIPLHGPKWREHHIDKYGFDTMFTSLLTVFQVTARDEWMRIANPIWETDLVTSKMAWVFFMVMLVLLGLMCVNLFLASITLAYLDLQKEIRQEEAIKNAHESLIGALLAQAGGDKAAGVLYRAKSSDSEGEDGEEATGLKAFCQQFTESAGGGQKGPHADKFGVFIIFIVVLNTISMAAESYHMGNGFALFLAVCEAIFTFIYTAEAAIKIIGLGAKGYFGVNLNRLDFFIVFTALLSYGVQAYVSATLDENQVAGDREGQGSAVLRIIRIFRVIRAARALRIGKVLFRSKAISQILGMAFSSMSAIVSLLYMIFLTLTVSAISVRP